MQVYVNDWSLVIFFSPRLGTPTCPFTLVMLQTKKHIPILFSSVVFTFSFSLHLGASTRPSTSIVLHISTIFSSIVFTFKLTFKSFKDCDNVLFMSLHVWHDQKSWLSKKRNHDRTFCWKLCKHLLRYHTWCTYWWSWCSQRHHIHNHFIGFVYECVCFLAVFATLYMLWALEQN